MTKKVRVLLVDDMVFMSRMFKSILESDPEIEVVGVAKNGKEAIKLTETLKPEVILMDIHMPEMDGLEATRHIMHYCPTPILIMSSSDIIMERKASFEALRIGALDVMEKPDGSVSADLKEIGAPITRKLKRFSRIRVIPHISNMPSLEGAPKSLPTPTAPPPSLPTRAPTSAPKTSSASPLSSPVKIRGMEKQGKDYSLLALGASTGGPAALLELLSVLPDSFNLPMILVQHISENFVQAFATWLGNNLPREVKLAENLEYLLPSKIYVAPSLKHITVDKNLQIHFQKEPSNLFHIPSVDVFFDSVAKSLGPRCIGVLLTGMGKDGAQGLLSIKEAGGKTFAQDEESSAVFGMPKEALNMGAAPFGMKPKQIAGEIGRLCANQENPTPQRGGA